MEYIEKASATSDLNVRSDDDNDNDNILEGQLPKPKLWNFIKLHLQKHLFNDIIAK
ncbi:hypothetical protein C0995_003116, partial [Termitomyces sp. Mi166